jgi:putative ABC transport system ATP-binding protein
MSAAPEMVLRADALVRRIGTREIVAGVDVALARGESASLVGPSGCGKTTLLQILGALDRPDGGTVHVGATDVWSVTDNGRAELRRDRIGFVFQQNNLLDGLTALENVALPAWRASGSKKKALERARALLDRFGLDKVASSKAAELSGGEAQRVAIARAIVNEPAVVLADEPTGSLDSSSARIVMDALLAACERGAALLLVTHDPEIAARASRTIAMLDGRLVRPSILPAG